MKKILSASFLFLFYYVSAAQQFNKNDIYKEPFINSDFKQFLKESGKERKFIIYSRFIQYPVREDENLLKDFKDNYNHPKDTEVFRDMKDALSKNENFYEETKRIKTLLNISKIALTLCKSTKNSYGYAKNCNYQRNNYNSYVNNYNKANNKTNYWYERHKDYLNKYNNYINEYNYEEEKAGKKYRALQNSTLTQKQFNEYKHFFLELKQEYYNYKKNGLAKEIKKTYFDSGQLQTVSEIKGIYYDGKSTTYFKNGNKKLEGFYKKNELIGEWVHYYINGKVKEKQQYKNGQIEGLLLAFNQEGELEGEIEFKSGKRNGLLKKYHKNRKISVLENYINGKAEGKSESFYENGSFKDKTYYKNDKLEGVYIIYYDNGSMSYKTQYKKGCRFGITEWYFENGQLETKAEYNYEEGNEDGLRWNLLEMFDKNGNVLEKGTLKNGNGTWNSYDEDGDLNITKIYKNGIRVN